MATLRANGPELLRMSTERDTPDDKSVSWRRTTVVYFKSGAILRKDDTRFRPTQSWDKPEGRFYSWGWKKIANAKDNKDVVAFANKARTMLTEKGWNIEFSELGEPNGN